MRRRESVAKQVAVSVKELTMQSLRCVSLLAASMVLSGAFLHLAHAQSPNVTVSVTGSGASIDEAKADTIRQALQQTMIQLVVVDRAISGNTILRDKIMSTMNGYIEKFQQREIKRSEKGYEFTAEITVSASRIENFIGITTGGAGPIEGESLLAEQNTRRAQIQGGQLQVQARGEIFDRMFRGFPSDAIDIKVLGMKLSEADLNILQIKIEYAYKPTFVAALEGTLHALALHNCIRPSGNRNPKDGLKDLEEAVIQASYELVCRDGQRPGPPVRDKAKKGIGKIYDAVCLGYPSIIKCFALPPGTYCASCRLEDFSASARPRMVGGGIYFDTDTRIPNALTPSPKGLMLFGRFVDVAGQSANTTDNCLVLGATLDRTQNKEQVLFQAFIEHEREDIKREGKETSHSHRRLVAGFDFFNKKYATIEVNTSFVDLAKAKYFVAVPGLTSSPTSFGDLGKKSPTMSGLKRSLFRPWWVTNLVPDTDRQAKEGCDLIDEAVQRQLLSR